MKKRQRGRCDPASSGRWCTSTRRWQPHPLLSGTGVHTQRNAFPGVYLTVPHYTSDDRPPPVFLVPRSLFLRHAVILSRRPSPGIASRPVLNKRAKCSAGKVRAPFNHVASTKKIRYNIFYLRCRSGNYSSVWCRRYYAIFRVVIFICRSCESSFLLVSCLDIKLPTKCSFS